jgi:hypothetical protein
MTFRAEIDYSKEDIRRFNRTHKRLRYRKLYIFIDVLAVLALAGALATYGLAAVRGVWNESLTRLTIMLAVMTGFWLYTKMTRNAAVLRGLNAMGTTTVTTTEDGLHAASGGMSTDLPFSMICDIVHYQDTYYLYVNKHRATILPERCFVEGDPAAFGAFLAEKTGLEVKELN